jgi:hypothetical protein
VLAEYAVQNSGGFGNMRAALSEAVMLSGIERNSDVMPMASYAPLLANVHAINWRPDLIYFDSVASYGTPSYYVQKMFADSRLDSVVPVQVNADDIKVRMDGEVSAGGFRAKPSFRTRRSPAAARITRTRRAPARPAAMEDLSFALPCGTEADRTWPGFSV